MYGLTTVRGFKWIDLQFFYKVHAAKPQKAFGISKGYFRYNTSQNKIFFKEKRNMIYQVRLSKL